MLAQMLRFSGEALGEARSYKLISAIVTPRPIAWVASRNAAGAVNLAPFSSYTFISYNPAKILISVGPGVDVLKDTLANIEARGEFTVSSVTAEFLDSMVDSSFAYANGESEAEALGIALEQGTSVATPFVKGVAAAMECTLDRIIEVGDRDHHRLIIGTVTCFHVDPAVWQGDRIDPKAYRPLGRIGGPLYQERGEIVVRPAPRERVSRD